MDYVMVPVPEEHATTVKQFVTWIEGREEVAPWDDDALSEAVLGLDRPSRDLLSVVADAVLDDDPLSIAEVGLRLHRPSREILGNIIELNHRVPPPNGAGLLLQLRPVGTELHEQHIVTDDSTARSLRALRGDAGDRRER